MYGFIGIFVVYWIVVIAFICGIFKFIIKKIKGIPDFGARKKTPNNTAHTAGANQNPNSGPMMQNRNPQNGHWGQNMPWSNGRNMSNRQMSSSPVSARPVRTAAGAAGAGMEEESTTAYLAKKAEEDAREHAKEKWEEEKRLRQARGGLEPAQRYLEGDPCPQGKRCVVCGYCAAENLVPMVPRTRYSCYFCREPL